jgi:glutamyl-tRNA synthetase
LGEVASLFGLDAVGRSGARADPDKLLHLNQHYIKTLPRDLLVARMQPFLEALFGRPVQPTEELGRLVDLQRERSKTLVDLAGHCLFLVAEKVVYQEEAARKHLRREIAPALADLHHRLSALAEWSEEALAHALQATREAQGGIAMGKLAQPVRVAVTGGVVSPGIFETLAVLGRERSLVRIAEAIRWIERG